MILLKDRDIEYLLAIAGDGHKTFGEANVALAKYSPLIQQSAERHLTYFQLKSKPAYGLLIEAQNLGMEPYSGPVKFVINYHDKHPVGKSSAPNISDSQNLGDLLSKAKESLLGFDYVAGALEKAGFKWTDGFNRNRTYSGEAILDGVQAGVRVDLHEVPDNPKLPRNYSLEIYVKVCPQFKSAPAPTLQPVPQTFSPQLVLPLRFALRPARP